MTITQEQATWFAQTFAQLADNVERAVLGKRHVVELVLAAMLSDGHVLLEDVPGTGKTSLARAMAQSVQGTNTRIQFTPDLLPGDITGITVYDQATGKFEFHSGPVFANIVLADEINRASPKTQSALLEVMEEGRVTVDGVSRQVGVPFLVLATQNPVEQAGTYRLPEAQLDRFMMRTSLGYPDHASTVRILDGAAVATGELAAVITPQALVGMADLARDVYIDALVLDYIARLVDATRSADEVRLGVSIRGALALTRASRTRAASLGRTYSTPDDVKALAVPVLSHRLILHPEAEFDGVTQEAVIGQVLLDVAPPSRREADEPHRHPDQSHGRRNRRRERDDRAHGGDRRGRSPARARRGVGDRVPPQGRGGHGGRRGVERAHGAARRCPRSPPRRPSGSRWGSCSAGSSGWSGERSRRSCWCWPCRSCSAHAPTTSISGSRTSGSSRGRA